MFSETTEDKTAEEQNNPMIIILGTLVGIAILIIAGIATAAGMVLCKKRTCGESRHEHDYETSLQTPQKIIQNKEDAFIVKVPVVRPIVRDTHKPNNMNNTTRKSIHEVLPLEVDVNALRTVHDVLPIEGASIQTVVIRRNTNTFPGEARKSLSFAPSNNTENDKDKKREIAPKESKPQVETSKPVLLRTSVYEEGTKRCHPRVTLSPDGEVMRCVMEQGELR